MSERGARRRLAAALVWILVVVIAAVLFKLIFLPKKQAKLMDATGSESIYAHDVRLAADSFSGYCIFRSDTMQGYLRDSGIRLTVVDDKADYAGRIKALRRGDVQMAVFTIDSFVKASALLGEYPATIVAIIDETKGADAIVAYKSAVPNIDALNNPAARMVLTADSPSEFLGRIVLAHFSLPQLPEQWWLPADGAADVLARLKAGARDGPRAFILWEPYVSMALEDKEVHVLLDSSKIQGYIVDVLVAQRDFLRDNHAVVKSVVEAYFRALYAADSQKGGMQEAVLGDSNKAGAEVLTKPQVERLVVGIQWKNTLENYAHFGLAGKSVAASGGLWYIEDTIRNIVKVLRATKALDEDPAGGRIVELFYAKIVAEMQTERFHPARQFTILDTGGDAPQAVRAVQELPALDDAQWGMLVPVGMLKVEPISFARGTATVSVQSRRDLEELAAHLKSWPQYYLIVTGHARAEGDVAENLRLAQARADAASACLHSLGIVAHRIRTNAAQPSIAGGAAQSVSFTVGQLPY